MNIQKLAWILKYPRMRPRYANYDNKVSIGLAQYSKELTYEKGKINEKNKSSFKRVGNEIQAIIKGAE
jgi:hypothetical protein